MVTMTRKIAGDLRVRAAMEHVEAAQVQLMRACADLCSVIGFGPEWMRVSKLHGLVKATWYRIDAKRSKARRGRNGELDRATTERDHNPHVTGCGAGGI